MPITAAEVGRLAGVSTATVSRALNNTGAVSAKAREAIQRALRETRYAPRSANKQRREKETVSSNEQSSLVEIIFHRHSRMERISFEGEALNVEPADEIPSSVLRARSFQLSVSFHRQVIDGAIAELSRCGIRAVLHINHDLTDPQFLAEMNKPDKCGVLLVGEEGADVARFARECVHPLILVDFIRDGANDVVTMDNAGGITAAFNHLYGMGHRHFGFIGFRENIPQFNQRFLTYRMKLAEASLPFNSDWVYTGFEHIEEVAAGVTSLLSSTARPTALLCANDVYAVSVIRAANRLGIDIPGQLSVVGFDDIDVASMVTPALTTIHVPQSDMGKRAARQLVTAMRLPDPDQLRGCEIKVKTDLVVRESTGPVPAGH